MLCGKNSRRALSWSIWKLARRGATERLMTGFCPRFQPRLLFRAMSETKIRRGNMRRELRNQLWLPGGTSHASIRASGFAVARRCNALRGTGQYRAGQQIDAEREGGRLAPVVRRKNNNGLGKDL